MSDLPSNLNARALAVLIFAEEKEVINYKPKKMVGNKPYILQTAYEFPWTNTAQKVKIW